MKPSVQKTFRHWKFFYLIGSLVYMAWTIHAGAVEFDRINSQYQRLGKQLDADRIRKAAVEELTAECLRGARNRVAPEEESCSSWPVPVVEAKAKEVEKHRLRAKERGRIKVALFYAGFIVIFLLGPPTILFLLLVGAIKVYRSVKFVRE